MVQENNIDAIVMITGLTEKGQSKCHRYWPTAGTSMTVANFVITNIETMDHPGYTRTSLTIKQGKDKPRPLVHWWFTGWPDHGTPKKDGKLWADDVLTCMIEVNKFIADNASRVKVKKGAELPPPPPILLHCSAGVGRTGTFVAIAHGMEHLKTAGSASPLKIVRTIRQDRMALVQHPKQFEFVHASLVRWAQMCHADYVVAKPKLQGKKAKFTAEEAVTQRGLEKSQAKVRLQETMKSGQKLKRRSSALRMKAIKDKSTGTAIQFQEDDSTGEMPKAAAIQQGMTQEMFDQLDVGNTGSISAKDFSQFADAQALEDLRGEASAEDIDEVMSL